MSLDKCIAEITKVGNITEDQARQMLVDLERKLGEYNDSEDLYKVLNAKLTQQATSKMIKRMSYIENAIKAKKGADFLKASGGGKGRFAFDVAITNFINRITNRKDVIEKEFHALVSDLYQKEFGKGSNFREFFKPGRNHDTKKLVMFISELADKPAGRALNSLSDEDQALYKMAKVIKTTNDHLRVRLERAGVPIGYLPGRIGFQTWDTIKIAGKEEEFYLNALAKFDWKKIGVIGGEAKKREWLKTLVLEMQSGIEAEGAEDLASFTAKELKSKQTNLKSGFDFQNILAKKREIFVKPEYWDEMQEQFGGGNILTNFQEAITKAARNLSLIDQLGTNPEAGFNRILERFAKEFPELNNKNGEHIANLANNQNLANSLKEALGQLDRPKDYMMARTFQSARKLAATAKMGGSLIINIADVAVRAMRSSQVAGGNPTRQIQVFTEELLNGYKLTKSLYGDNVARQIWETAEEHLEDSLFDLSRKYRFADIGGSMTEVGGKYNISGFDKALNASDKFNDAVYSWNGMEMLTFANKKNSYVSIGRDFGHIADQGYDSLEDIHKFWLADTGIEKEAWDLIRTKAVKSEAGRTYITPDAANNFTKDEILSYLKAKGVQNPSSMGIQKAREELQLSWQAAYGREADKRVLSPGATTRAFFTRGSRRGTLSGELLRNFAQLKSFPVALAQEIILPALVRKQHTSLSAFAVTSIAMMTALSAVKDILANKTPRKLYPESDDDMGIVISNWGGILGSAAGLPFASEIISTATKAFTEGSSSAMGSAGKTLLGLAGPATGDFLSTTIMDIPSMLGDLAQGEPEKAAKTAGNMLTNAPFIGPALYGHFLSRTFKATIYNSFFELWDPDYSDRLSDNAERQGSEIIFE